MARIGRLFLPLDVNFFDSDMFDEVGEPAAVLYLAMCCKAKSLFSDGVVSRHQVARFGLPRWEARLKKLIAAGHVVEIEEDKLWIPAWTQHNETVEQITEKRRKDRERKGLIQKDSARIPGGFRTDSALREKLETERREVRLPPHGPCPGCADPDCPSPSLRVVSHA